LLVDKVGISAATKALKDGVVFSPEAGPAKI